MMFCDKLFHPFSHYSFYFPLSVFGIYHEFPSYIFFVCSHSIRMREKKIATHIAGAVEIFLFQFSVVLLFFILAMAINNWNVFTQNAYYYFCIQFIPTRIFSPFQTHIHTHRMQLNIQLCPCPVYKCVYPYEYQIILECLSFICLFIYLFCSLLNSQLPCIENIPILALNNNFIVKYWRCRILFCIHRSIPIATILPPAKFFVNNQKLGWHFSTFIVVIYN